MNFRILNTLEYIFSTNDCIKFVHFRKATDGDAYIGLQIIWILTLNSFFCANCDNYNIILKTIDLNQECILIFNCFVSVVLM